ncbi:MAG: phosphate transport system regulatory protein PhoU [Elusimicrobia bacterium RIFOXYD2_FULL_34_15]|nr:MAG: phosphate transport system regulatory protein PhoU [Elusimicrobia bacterium RIFOXYD2_FULL_34_15]
MERHFDEELEQLKSKLLKMASLVEVIIAKSIKSLEERNPKLTEKVWDEEDAINMLEIDIDEQCHKLLALRQPMAIDLRFITSAMKINNDLERMGDLAVNIVDRTKIILQYPQLKPLNNIPQMAVLAQEMVRESLNALVNRDSKIAREICKKDNKVDDINDELFRELLTYMMQNPKNIEAAIDLILVARNIERIADHATNIAEDVIYLVEGKTIKHHFEERNLKQE